MNAIAPNDNFGHHHYIAKIVVLSINTMTNTPYKQIANQFETSVSLKSAF